MNKRKAITGFLEQLKDGIIDFESKAERLVNSMSNYDITSAIKDIKENLLGWVKSGILLDAIKSEFSFTVLRNKLAKNWQDFCARYFEKSHWYADKLIDAAKVVLILVKNGFSILPSCESQARELVKFLPDPEYKDYENEYLEKELCHKWSEVLKASEGKPITAGLILAIVDPEKADSGSTNLRLPKHIKETLKDMALKNGNLTINEYLEKLTIEYKIAQETDEETNDLSKEKEQEWENDLQDLLQEYGQENENKSKGFGKQQPVKQVARKVNTKQARPTQNNNFVQNVTQNLSDMVTELVNTVTRGTNPPYQENLNTT